MNLYTKAYIVVDQSGDVAQFWNRDTAIRFIERAYSPAEAIHVRISEILGDGTCAEEPESVDYRVPGAGGSKQLCKRRNVWDLLYSWRFPF